MADIRKSYVDCRYGQLHLRTAGAGGLPLVCFHMSPYSGLHYEPFMKEMAKDSLVIAPDTPGYGGSDSAGEAPTMADFAAAMLDMLDALELDQVDMMGFHTGTFVALALADLAPERVRKLILPGIPYADVEGRDKRLAMFSGDRPYFTEDGYVQKRWDLGLKGRGDQSDDRFIALFAESVRTGVSGMNRGFAAVYRFDPNAAINSLDKPVFIPVPDEMLAESTREAAKLFNNATIEEWPDLKGDLFDVAAAEVAYRMRKWLDQ
ncbi:MAG: alpha/beta hydrolase [Kordiimonadaceae bacterium]|nr:alpha/beta hydrolase [Kordiimonadaceae bacterium]MBO6567306.1 alpha/beta hydrolase [Kordiimonadaceae bacterium]MBO6963480.1 alpha/beta hydrolase [Kordiimonadaceae bacterium]